MIKAGLTGNMGSGKSTVAEIFRFLGVPVFHADDEAKKLLDDPKVIVELENRFGTGIFIREKVDKKKLATLVFNDKNALSNLNAIIHPRVRENLNHWIIANREFPYVIQEAAILFESGFYTFFDVNILVACPETVAIERVMTRDGASEPEVRARLKNQWPEERKRPLVDYIIENDGSSLLIPRVLQIHHELMKK